MRIRITNSSLSSELQPPQVSSSQQDQGTGSCDGALFKVHARRTLYYPVAILLVLSGFVLISGIAIMTGGSLFSRTSNSPEARRLPIVSGKFDSSQIALGAGDGLASMTPSKEGSDSTPIVEANVPQMESDKTALIAVDSRVGSSANPELTYSNEQNRAIETVLQVQVGVKPEVQFDFGDSNGDLFVAFRVSEPASATREYHFTALVEPRSGAENAFSLLEAPPGMSIHPHTGEISYTVTKPTRPQSYNVIIKVTGTTGLTTTVVRHVSVGLIAR